MFFVSKKLINCCSNLEILPGYRTDHNKISMHLQTNLSQRGPGLWKLNESLLTDDNYIEIVNECITKAVEDYALPVYAREFLANDDNYRNIQFQTNDGIFYETLIMLIRGETVKYSKRKARQRRTRETELEAQVARVNSQFFKKIE